MTIVPQEALAPMLDPRLVRRVGQLVHDAAGIVINDGKASMVRARLNKRLFATGHRDVETYLDYVEGEGREVELGNLISAMTTNVTQFFREAHHFDILARELVPSWRGERRKRQVWSAACSSGPEPYSIGMTLREAGLGHGDVRILATDIDRAILARAHAGRYPLGDVDSVPGAIRQRYFASVDGAAEVSAEIRAMVTFRYLNLIGSWPFIGRFDAIFCRNVAIYFDADTQDRLWSRLIDSLHPGGRLFIGHSERLPETLMSRGVVYLGQTSYMRADDRSDFKSV